MGNNISTLGYRYRYTVVLLSEHIKRLEGVEVLEGIREGSNRPTVKLLPFVTPYSPAPSQLLEQIIEVRGIETRDLAVIREWLLRIERRLWAREG